MKTLALLYRTVKRDKLLASCAVFLLLVVALAFVGIHFTGYTYDQISNDSLQKPSFQHWFGTDVTVMTCSRARFSARKFRSSWRRWGQWSVSPSESPTA